MTHHTQTIPKHGADAKRAEPHAAAVEPKCWRLEETPPFLKARYERFALVSHQRHLADLDPEDEQTLIVSCDWILWQTCLAEGRHCVFYEMGLLDWDGDGLSEDLMIAACDAFYIDGVDATVFDGVSLGQQLVRDLAYFLYGYARLAAALKALTRRFRPTEYVLYDYHVGTAPLDMDEIRTLVTEVGEEFGVTVAEKCDPLSRHDPATPILPSSTSHLPLLMTTRRNGLRSWPMALFEWTLDTLSVARRAVADRRPLILLVATHLNMLPILEKLDDNKACPMVIAKVFPNKRDFGFILHCLRHGTVFVRSRLLSLSVADRKAVDDMQARLIGAWRHAAKGRDAALRRHIRKHVLEKRVFHRLAEEATYCRWLLSRHRPHGVLTDSLLDPTYFMLVSMAAGMGARTSYTWHGPYLQNLRLSLLDGDRRRAPIVDQCLTWGPIQEKWLDSIGFKGKKIRTGNVVAMSRLSVWPPRPMVRETVPSPGTRRVLVLQYTPVRSDILGLDERQYAAFVDIVRLLRRLGFKDIRFRLHPGAWRISYYKSIAALFRLDCPIHEGGAFKDAVNDADIVIGPVQSGAMNETIAEGKPYYPILFAPHCLDPALLDVIRPYRDLASLERDLARGSVVDQKRILDACCSFDEAADPARRAWRVLEETALEAASATNAR